MSFSECFSIWFVASSNYVTLPNLDEIIRMIIQQIDHQKCCFLICLSPPKSIIWITLDKQIPRSITETWSDLSLFLKTYSHQSELRLILIDWRFWRRDVIQSITTSIMGSTIRVAVDLMKSQIVEFGVCFLFRIVIFRDERCRQRCSW